RRGAVEEVRRGAAAVHGADAGEPGVRPAGAGPTGVARGLGRARPPGGGRAGGRGRGDGGGPGGVGEARRGAAAGRGGRVAAEVGRAGVGPNHRGTEARRRKNRNISYSSLCLCASVVSLQDLPCSPTPCGWPNSRIASPTTCSRSPPSWSSA